MIFDLNKPINKMTLEEIEEKYNSLEYEKQAGRTDYKDLMLLDLLDEEINNRKYEWTGHGLIEKED